MEISFKASPDEIKALLPGCGYAVGAGLSHCSTDGPAIKVRFPHVILEVPCT